MKISLSSGVLFLLSALLFLQCKDNERVFLDTSIQAPTLVTQAGFLFYGTDIEITSNQTNSILEYSTDNGKTWQTGNIVPFKSSMRLLARNRVNTNVSETITAEYKLKFHRVLIIGNSITRHGPLPEAGWKGDWGMAASAPDKDYVSLVKKELSSRNDSTTFLATNKGSTFETDYWNNYDLTVFKEEKNFKPDLIIIRLAENVEDNKVKSRNFEAKFEEFLKYLTGDNYKGKVICTGGFWERWEASTAISKVCERNGYHYIELFSLYNRTNTAYGQFVNKGVAEHPSDQGMREIYNRLSLFF